MNEQTFLDVEELIADIGAIPNEARPVLVPEFENGRLARLRATAICKTCNQPVAVLKDTTALCFGCGWSTDKPQRPNSPHNTP